MKGLEEFNAKNHPAHVRYMFEGGNATGFKILYLLSITSEVYGVRAISKMIGSSPASVSSELKKLLEAEFLIKKGDKYRLKSGIVNSHKTVQDTKQSVQDTKQSVQDSEIDTIYYNIYKNTNKEYIDTNNNENNVILSEEDKEIDSFFKIPDETIKTDNRYMNAGLRPLNKFPDIWLTIESFKYVLDCIEKAKVDKGGVFNRVKQKLDNWKALGRSTDCVDCASWLTGWALDAQIEHEAKNLKLNFYRENQK